MMQHVSRSFLNFAPRNIFPAFLSSADFLQNQIFQKILSGIRSVSNRLDLDSVWSDLVPNCLQKLSADDIRR